MIVIVFILLAISTLTVLIYAITLVLAKLINGTNKQIPKFPLARKFKILVFLFSFFFAIALCSYHLLSSRSFNYKTAYIEKSKTKYILTVYSQKSLMAHDPISLLERKTYLDSSKLEIPINKGIIDGKDIIFKDTYFNFLKGSSLTITNNALNINLVYLSNYDSSKSESFLNGEYSLKWR